MNHRWLALAAIVVLMAAVALDCGRRERDPGLVELWTLQLSPTFDDYMNGILGRFEATHPGVKVRWVDVPYEGFTQKLIAALSAGDAPDVVNLPADLILQYVRLDALASVDTLIPDDQQADYLPAALEPMRFGGQTYGVPWYLATKILIADSTALLAAGLSTDLPTTYDGILTLALAYRAKTGRPGFFFNLVVDSYMLQVFESEGIPVLSSDGRRAVFAVPQAVKVLQGWLEAFSRGALPRESLMAGHQGGIDLYQAGAVPMFIGAPQFLRLIAENAPDRLKQTIVAPAPTGAAGWKELDVMALAVTSTSRNPRAAADLAAFITSGPVQLEFSKLVPVFPSVRSALQDRTFRMSDGSLAGTARLTAAVQLPAARVLRPSIPQYPRLREIFKDQMLACFLGRRTAGAALAEAQRQWNEVLAEP